MSMEQRIRDRLVAHLDPVHVDLIDETSQHNVPPDAQSHWKLTIVSAAFEGLRSVQRHQSVYRALAAEMQGGIHALALTTLSPDEWAAAGGAVENPSPPCLGGSKEG